MPKKTDSKSKPKKTVAEKPGTVVLSADRLRIAIQAVMLAASKDETRPHLRAVCLDVGANNVRLAATNGHWLAEWTEDVATTDVVGAPFRLLIGLDGCKSLVTDLVELRRRTWSITDASLTREVPKNTVEIEAPKKKAS